MKYSELKEALAKLSPEQLEKEVTVLGEGINTKTVAFEVLEEDYGDPGSDYLEPLSIYKNDPMYNDLDLTILYPTGTPVICLEIE